MEIDEQTDSQLRETKVRQQLSFIYRMDRGLGLQFDDYRAVDDEVGPKAAVELRDDSKTTSVFRSSYAIALSFNGQPQATFVIRGAGVACGYRLS